MDEDLTEVTNSQASDLKRTLQRKEPVLMPLSLEYTIHYFSDPVVHSANIPVERMEEKVI